MADGSIRIQVKLDSSGLKKQAQEINKDLKVVQEEADKTEKSLDTTPESSKKPDSDSSQKKKEEEEQQNRIQAEKEEEARRAKAEQEAEAKRREAEAKRLKAEEEAREKRIRAEKEAAKKRAEEEDKIDFGRPEEDIKWAKEQEAKEKAEAEKRAREEQAAAAKRAREEEKRLKAEQEQKSYDDRIAAEAKKLEEKYPLLSGDVEDKDFSTLQQETADLSKNLAKDMAEAQKEYATLEKERAKESAGYEKRIEAGGTDGEAAQAEYAAYLERNGKELDSVNAKIEALGRAIDAVNGVASTINNVSGASAQVDKAMRDDQFANSIQSQEEYDALLAEIEEKMAAIEAHAERISQETGMSKEGILAANPAYQSLADKMGVLKGRTFEFGKQAQKAGKEAQEEMKKTKKETEKASGSFASGIKKLAKMGLAIFGIQGAYEGVRSVLNEYLATNEQLAGTMETLKAGFASVLGPAIEWVINLLVKAISAVNSFVYALTGINFVAKANAAALKKQNSAAGGSGRQSAGFDEQTKLSASGGGGGNPYVGTLPDGTSFDLSFIEPLMEAIRKFKEDITPLLETVGSLLKWVWEEVLVPFGDWALNSALPGFLDVLGAAALVLNEALEFLQPAAQWFWDNVLKPIAEWTGGVIVDVLSAIGGWMRDHKETLGAVVAVLGVLVGLFVVIPPLITAIGAVLTFLTSPITIVVALITGLIALFITLYDECEGFRAGMDKAWSAIKDIFSAAVDFVKALFAGDWAGMEAAWDRIKEAAKNLWEGLVEGLKAGWEWCKEKVSAIWNKIVEKFKEIFGIHSPSRLFADFGGYMMDGLVNGLKNAISKVTQACRNVWSAIKDVFSSVGSWFKDTFSKAWQNVKNVFSAGGKIFDGIKEGIASTFKTIVNGLIDGINRVIAVPFNAINRTLNTIRSVKVLGIAPFQNLWGYNPLSVPQIPKLARGGIVNRPGRGVPAIIGEAGAEAVLPLENNTEWMDILADKIGGGTVTIPINLDGKRIATYIVDIQKKKAFATNGV
jgi:hypothetical protein